MPEVIFTGPAGRLEGRYHPAKQKNAPIAMVLHPHPQFGGTMNHQIVYQCYYAFVARGFSRNGLICFATLSHSTRSSSLSARLRRGGADNSGFEVAGGRFIGRGDDGNGCGVRHGSA